MVSFMASGGYDKPSDKDRGERLDEKSKNERKRSEENGGGEENVKPERRSRPN